MPLRFATLIPLVIALSSCKRPEAAEAPERFTVAVPSRAEAHYEREYVGEVHAAQRAELRARVKGRIEAVAVDEGQAVKAGQLLFSISSKELQQELRRARAVAASAASELQSAELERANTKMLHEKSVVSAAEMALVESKIQSLVAKVEEARAHQDQAAINLSHAEVRAPFDGVINRIPKKVGSLVDAGELLTTLANTSEVLVYYRVSEQEYLEYVAAKEEGRTSEVSFKLANGALLQSVGKTDAVESEIDRGTGTIAFRARFANDRDILKHGSSGKVVVKAALKNAVVVPQRSTFEVQDHVYVYVIDAEGKARARRIHPKVRLGDSFIVESGIGVDERFIAEGVQKVKDGEPVAIGPAGPSSTSAL